MVLSIIIPVFNIENYLAPCFKALTELNDGSFEVLFIDDGSTDRSGGLCDDFALSNDFAKTLHKTNGGLSDARNFGILNCRGDYVLFLDGDDYLDPNKLKSLIRSKVFSDVPDVVCIDLEKTNGNKTINRSFYPCEKCNGVSFFETQLVKGKMHAAAWRYICNRRFLLSNSLFFRKGIYHEDEEWTPRVLLLAENVICSGCNIYRYVVRDNSIMTSKRNLKHLRDFSQTLNDTLSLYSAFENTNLFSLLKTDLVDKYLTIFTRRYVPHKYRKQLLGRKELSGNIVSLKTRVKLCLFLFSKDGYFLLSKLLRLVKRER